MIEIEQGEKKVAGFIVKMKKCRERLNEIAMRPHTMPSEEYLQQVVEKPDFSTNLVAPFAGDEKILYGWPVRQRGRQCHCIWQSWMLQ